MTADATSFDQLSHRLWEGGVAAFCPTTLSSPPRVLRAAVGRMGRWIRSGSAPGALPLGIHLEGPFINSHACGAHPPGLLRPLNFLELEALWEASLGTLKILTVAPEMLDQTQLKKLVKWADSRKIRLSAGHSHATESQAQAAFEAGFRGVTHAWNALAYHHRDPGILGAAISRSDSFIELIIDQVHVAPEVIRWTQTLQPADRLCFVSDCVPAAETPGGRWHSFGSLKIRCDQGACRLPGGALAGGGRLLTRTFEQWVRDQAQTKDKAQAILRRSLPSITSAPLRYLGVAASKLSERRVHWVACRSGKQWEIQAIPG